MHQAIPYRTFLPTTATTRASRDLSPSNDNGVDPGTVVKMVLENAVIIIGKRGCCMCHVVQRLLQGLGVNPPLYEVPEADEAAVAAEISRNIGSCDGGVQFPAVFVGGKLFGGLERVMSTHISGELVPILKDAGALWL